jgi:osmotically-inducible protein OsmY
MDLHIPGRQRNDAPVGKRAERAARAQSERLRAEVSVIAGRQRDALAGKRAEWAARAQSKRLRAEARRLRAEARLIGARARLLAARRSAGEDRSTSKRIAIGLGAIAVGAAGAYFLDAENGRRRRHVIRDKALSFARSRGADLRRAAEYRKGQAVGAAHRATPQRDEGVPDDVTMADKVRSEVLRPSDVPSGAVNVNVEDGVVYLRGEIEDQERIERLVESTLGVEGVTKVESLLHLPGEPAPNKGDGVVVNA